MNYAKIEAEQMDDLWPLQLAYKVAIEEGEPPKEAIERLFVRVAYENSGAESLTVGGADCGVEMYGALGFAFKIGNRLAFEYRRLSNERI